MAKNGKANSTLIRFRRFILGISVLWTGAICVSLAANCFREYKDARKAAKVENRATFNKDLAYRRWSAEHGGVYVPITESTPPNPYLSHLVERDITTPSGRELTLVNPAYMTRQVHEIGAKRYGVQGHITSLDPIRPENAPDAWEKAALESIARGEVKEVCMTAKIDGEDYMRLMLPLITEKGCLKCHAKQGYKLGDIRGGISVSTPMKPHLEIARASVISLSVVHGGLWLVGIGGIFYGGRGFKQQLIKRRQAAQEREELLGKLESRTHDMVRFLRIVSHDLRAPLVNIAGFSEELKADCKRIRDILGTIEMEEATRETVSTIADENITTSIGFISSSVEKMELLLKGLSSLARVGRLELDIQPLDMNSLMQKVIETMRFQAKEANAKVDCEALPDCRGDEAQMNQVFSNLLANALKYLDSGREGKIRISGMSEGGMSVYCVEDNGVGIPDHHMDKVFEIFHRVDPDDSVGGEGLGLTAVKQIIERHNGNIRIESEVGKGSRFYVAIPSK